MNKTSGILTTFVTLFILQRLAIAVEVAPRISDREIVESLTEVRGDIKSLRAEIKGDINSLHAEMQGNIDSLRAELKGDIQGLRAELKGDIQDLRTELKGDIQSLRVEVVGIKGDIKRLEDGLMALDKGLNKRTDDLRSEMNSRFNTLQWMLGLFITIALAILGFVLRMQWQMHRRQTRMETVLETQRDELSFIRRIIEKFMPPSGVL